MNYESKSQEIEPIHQKSSNYFNCTLSFKLSDNLGRKARRLCSFTFSYALYPITFDLLHEDFRAESYLCIDLIFREIEAFSAHKFNNSLENCQNWNAFTEFPSDLNL